MCLTLVVSFLLLGDLTPFERVTICLPIKCISRTDPLEQSLARSSDGLAFFYLEKSPSFLHCDSLQAVEIRPQGFRHQHRSIFILKVLQDCEPRAANRQSGTIQGVNEFGL